MTHDDALLKQLNELFPKGDTSIAEETEKQEEIIEKESEVQPESCEDEELKLATNDYAYVASGFTQIDNRLLFILIQYLNQAEFAIFMMIWRLTVGFKKREYTSAISYDIFMKSMPQLLNRKAVQRAIKGLLDKNVISIKDDSAKHSPTKRQYKINNRAEWR